MSDELKRAAAPGVGLSPERRLGSVLVGGIFLGLMMIFFGVMAEFSEKRQAPLWGIRTVTGGGALLMLTSSVASLVRRDWARKAVIAAWGLTIMPFTLILIDSFLVRHFTVFEFLVAGGIMACIRSMKFFNAPEIRDCY
jgi:hypothetical protein